MLYLNLSWKVHLSHELFFFNGKTIPLNAIGQVRFRQWGNRGLKVWNTEKEKRWPYQRCTSPSLSWYHQSLIGIWYQYENIQHTQNADMLNMKYLYQETNFSEHHFPRLLHYHHLQLVSMNLLKITKQCYWYLFFFKKKRNEFAHQDSFLS